MIIVLPSELEQALTVVAQKQGRTPEQLALDSLRDYFLAPETDLTSTGVPPTLADFLDGYLGVLHSGESVPGGARLSENSGQKYAAALAAQRDQERE